MKKLFKQRKVRIIVLATLVLFLLGMAYTSFGLRREAKATDVFLKFDEGYGTTSAVHDTNGALTSAGTITGATWKTEDLCFDGKCLYFDGTDDKVTFDDNSNLNFVAADQFTITLWFRHKPITTGTQVLIAKANATAGYKILMESDGDITFGIDDDATWTPDKFATSTAATYDDNRWHHIAAVKNGTTSLTLYIDAVKVAEELNISLIGSLSNTQSFLIGVDGNGTSNYFNGFIDEVKVYRSAKTSTEIKGDFVKGSNLGETSASFLKDQSPLSDGLVGYWKMDETATPSADFSGNGNDGTWYNGVASASGKFGNAVSFDGTDDYLVINHTTSLNIAGSITIAAWIKPAGASNDYGRIVEKGYDSGGYSFTIGSGSGRDLAVWFENTEIIDTPEVLTDGVWSHVLMTYDGSNVYVYQNGAIIASAAKSGTRAGNTSVLNIGGESTGQRLNASLDEVRLYNRALSPGEVENLYNWAPGPVGWWKFDENSGSITNDRSGNENTGTLTSGPIWSTGKYGSAISYDGVDDYVNAGSGTSIDQIFNGGGTISAWIYPRSFGESVYGRIADKGGSGTNTGWGFSVCNNGGPTNCNYQSLLLYFDSNGGTSGFFSSDTNSITLNQWSHVVVTLDSSSVSNTPTFYINGVKKTTTVNQTPTVAFDNDEANSLLFGNRTNQDRTFDGLIDDIRMYDYTRTPAQIIEDMNAGHPAPGSPIGSAVAHWRFDEGYGDTANNSGVAGATASGNLAGTGGSCPGAATCPTWTNEGKFGKALEFGGADDFIDAGSDISVDNIFATGGSVATWIKADGFGENSKGRIIDKGSTYTALGLENGGVYCSNCLTLSRYFSGDAINNALWNTPNNSITTGSWIHIVVTYDESSINNDPIFYINGEKSLTSEYNDPLGSAVSDASSSLYIGDRSASDRGFHGLIDDLRIYRSILTADQVKILYNQGQSATFGVLSTASSSATMTSSARSYCPPGDTGTCNPPVADWKFDEKTGRWAYDSSSSENKLRTINSDYYKWDTGKTGSAINLWGTYLCIDDNSDSTCETRSSLQISGDLTIGMWIYPNNITNNQEIIDHSAYSPDTEINNTLYELKWNTTSGNDIAYTHEYGAGTNQDNTFDTNLSTSTWYYLTLVRDTAANTVKLYINGAQAGSTYTYTSDPTGGTSGVFGLAYRISSGYDTFDGKIDGVKIYNYARTPAQIAWDYNHGGPVTHWRLDECSSSDIKDSSGNGYDMTLTIGATGRITSIGDCTTVNNNASRYSGRNGKRNSSIDLDDNNANDYAKRTVSGFQSNDSMGSVSAWVKPYSYPSSYGYIFASADELTANKILGFLINLSGQVYVYQENNDTTDSIYTSSTIPTGSWSHIVWTSDGSTYKIYINGVLQKLNAAGGSNTGDWFADTTDRDNITIGILSWNSTYGLNFNGQIDEVKVFNYPLTGEQIKTEYNEGVIHFGP